LRTNLEVLLLFAGVAYGAVVLVLALMVSLMFGAAFGTVDQAAGERGLLMIGPFDAALVSAFFYSLFGSRKRAGWVAFGLLSLPLLLISTFFWT
jgi:hypothetical protein